MFIFLYYFANGTNVENFTTILFVGAVSNIPAVLPPGRFTTPVPTSQLPQQSLPHQQSATKVATFVGGGSPQLPPAAAQHTATKTSGIQLPTSSVQQVATKLGTSAAAAAGGHQYVARKSAPPPPVVQVSTSQVQKIGEFVVVCNSYFIFEHS